ncbi:hypothetical protein M3S_E07 [Sorghum bicolor]|uniref:Uncharacterized protein n=1 Tax=Sorghum bicolor TaxID=4558 RepID=H0I498_SORBI|nr:hypothetical protein M3S_E07 [Sorghum bicolor]
MGRFRKTLDDCELMELSLQNRRFTWSNERQEPTMRIINWGFRPLPVNAQSPGQDAKKGGLQI